MVMHAKEKKMEQDKLDWESWGWGWDGIAMLKMSDQLRPHNRAKYIKREE